MPAAPMLLPSLRLQAGVALRSFRCSSILLALVFFLRSQGVSSQASLSISSTLRVDKTDDKTKTHEHLSSLLKHAKDQKMEGNVIRFLDNIVQQTQKMLEAAKVVQEMKAVAVPTEFAPPKYKVKSMPKLQAKKNSIKKMTAKDLKKRLQEGKDINFDTPILVTNATALFDSGDWDKVRRHWSADRIMNDEFLEKEFQVEYWPPDKARARLVGNMLQMEDPDMISFSRYIIVCFHGTPAKPKLPGQNTEHCEQTVDASKMVHNSSELKELGIFPEIKNALPVMAKFKNGLIEAAGGELQKILGKGADKWKKRSGHMSFRYFVFGPSGSGDKLHAENGLPFFDILIHGSKRWLLMTEEEMERVAVKAREALEFDKTSAYMFFEEKLPELREEFGLKKYVEANQQAGDMVIVPSGWFRVSLSLADSISYYETVLSEKNTLVAMTDNNIWRPQFRQFQLAYCYDPKEMSSLPGVDKGGQLDNFLKEAVAKVKHEEQVQGILSVLMQCGSTLALDKAMPHLGARKMSTCTPAVWKQCRSKLEERLQDRGVDASLAWLPKEAPRSAEDVQAGGKSEEL